MNEEYNRKQRLQDARDKLAHLEQRTLDEIAHKVGIKGIVSNMNTMGTEDWERIRTCLYWLVSKADYPYDKTGGDLYADLDAAIKGIGVSISYNLLGYR